MDKVVTLICSKGVECRGYLLPTVSLWRGGWPYCPGSTDSVHHGRWPEPTPSVHLQRGTI